MVLIFWNPALLHHSCIHKRNHLPIISTVIVYFALFAPPKPCLTGWPSSLKIKIFFGGITTVKKICPSADEVLFQFISSRDGVETAFDRLSGQQSKCGFGLQGI
jgi:hypothetical protein